MNWAFAGTDIAALVVGYLLGSILVALSWQAAIVFAVVWLAAAATTRYSSVSALTASLITPPALLVLGAPEAAALFLVLTAILWLRHAENIGRLVAGTEGRIGQR